MCNNGRMSRFEKILFRMLLLAAAILAAEFIYPCQVLRILCICYGTPVAVVSNLVWAEPALGEKVFEKKPR
jgi:hypothetical protein